MELKHNEGITKLLWSPHNPDLNPIKNLGFVAAGIHMEQTVSLSDLDETLHRHWTKIARSTCMNLN